MTLEENIAALVEASVVRALEKHEPRASDGGPLLLDAKAIGVDRETFRRAGRAGEFPTFRAGRKLVAPRADVEAWIRRRVVEAATASPDNSSASVDESALDEFDRKHLRAVRGGQR